MRAAVLVKFGEIKNAFEIQEVTNPILKDGQVLIKTEGFGLNYADVMAVEGNYKDCPPLPAIIGYDVVGKIIETKGDCGDLKIGSRITAMSRFGGYAELVATESNACSIIKDDYNIGKAMAFTSQYSTAEFCFNEAQNIHEGDSVLIHAAAGGVGTALVQMALDRGCVIYATCGSDEKVAHLKSLGVQYPINYRREDFFEIIKGINGKIGLDAIFDAVGGSSVKKGFKLLGAGGRIVVFGAASMTGVNFFGKLKVAFGFGFYHPVQLIMNSKSIIGVNVLRIGDYRPKVLKRCLNSVVQQVEDGILDPIVAKTFTINQLSEALSYLKNRKTIGKVSVLWV